MRIQVISGFEQPEQIIELFREYTDMLVETDPTFARYLLIQNYDRELEHLGEKYAPPAGRLYLALADGAAAGCVALHKLDEERCELKRLYVRPAYRGQGLGSLLVDQILADAREIGYRAILLDTLFPLKSAIKMYRGLGFREISCYNDSPMEETLFMQLEL